MVLLGLDPGLAATGYGVVRADGPRYRLLDYGCLRTAAESELGFRLQQIHDGLTALIRHWRPECLVMEQLYALRGGRTGLLVGQAVGVLRLAAAEQGLAVAEYTPTHVKMTLVGHGQATKEQVQYMVQRLLNLPEPPRPDHASDALALCVCHCHSGLSRSAGRPDEPRAAAGRVADALAREEAERRRARKAVEG